MKRASFLSVQTKVYREIVRERGSSKVETEDLKLEFGELNSQAVREAQVQWPRARAPSSCAY
jgi:hypothetical protein